MASKAKAFVRLMDMVWAEGHVDAGQVARKHGAKVLWPSVRAIYRISVRGQVFEFGDKSRVFIFNRGAGCMTMCRGCQ